jgi:ABC-type polysaccharide/polyol phosphate export permease
MFFTFPVHVTNSIRALSLLLNTVVLIVMLVVAELVYSERPKEDRLHLRYFYPLIILMVALLVYAAYLQGVKD